MSFRSHVAALVGRGVLAVAVIGCSYAIPLAIATCDDLPRPDDPSSHAGVWAREGEGPSVSRGSISVRDDTLTLRRDGSGGYRWWRFHIPVGAYRDSTRWVLADSGGGAVRWSSPPPANDSSPRSVCVHGAGIDSCGIVDYVGGPAMHAYLNVRIGGEDAWLDFVHGP